jgi:hypothetical protein
MNSLETQLNNAIEEKGFRISPRGSLEDRLVRYMELSAHAKGQDLDLDDARGAAHLMILKNTNPSWSASWSSGATWATTGASWSNGASWSSGSAATNPWSGRTRSSSSRRPDFVEPERVVQKSGNGNVRVSFTSGSGSHPMVRRSQVSGRR